MRVYFATAFHFLTEHKHILESVWASEGCCLTRQLTVGHIRVGTTQVTFLSVLSADFSHYETKQWQGWTESHNRGSGGFLTAVPLSCMHLQPVKGQLQSPRVPPAWLCGWAYRSNRDDATFVPVLERWKRWCWLNGLLCSWQMTDLSPYNTKPGKSQVYLMTTYLPDGNRLVRGRSPQLTWTFLKTTLTTMSPWASHWLTEPQFLCL